MYEQDLRMVLSEEHMFERTIQECFQFQGLSCCPLVKQQHGVSYQSTLFEQHESVKKSLRR